MKFNQVKRISLDSSGEVVIRVDFEVFRRLMSARDYLFLTSNKVLIKYANEAK